MRVCNLILIVVIAPTALCLAYDVISTVPICHILFRIPHDQIRARFGVTSGRGHSSDALAEVRKKKYKRKSFWEVCCKLCHKKYGKRLPYRYISASSFDFLPWFFGVQDALREVYLL